MLPARGAHSFVYSLLPEGRFLTDLDRFYMKPLKRGSLLFRLRSNDYPEESEDVNVYAVELEDVDCERSEIAYGIHYLIAKFSDSRSIVLFRHHDASMFSFLYPLDEGRISIYFSDWLTPDTPDTGQLERMHVASTSLRSARECCDGFAFEAMRAYYKYPPSSASLWYEYMDTVNTTQEDYESIKEDALEYVTTHKLQYVNQYGDDYVDKKVDEVELDDDFNVDDIEWELQTANESDNGSASDDFQKPESDFEGWVPSNENIPAEVLVNPITLLEWINNHDLDTSTLDDSNLSEYADNNRIESCCEVSWTEDLQGIEPQIGSYVMHRSLGIGTVTHVGKNDFSATFGKQRRLFVYPYAFEKGITILLRKNQ